MLKLKGKYVSKIKLSGKTNSMDDWLHLLSYLLFQHVSYIKNIYA